MTEEGAIKILILVWLARYDGYALDNQMLYEGLYLHGSEQVLKKT